jgi:hypothetical protein
MAFHETCGSWLASDSSGSGNEEVGCAGKIAGKPAPTGIFAVPGINGKSQNLWCFLEWVVLDPGVFQNA